mmetsp:Transcript_21277/g.24189  ORF Transcript_21277/g.24189 Transcript_21277/m.24189 type:complete len:225 (+) Transcript_21277:82-756(+)
MFSEGTDNDVILNIYELVTTTEEHAAVGFFSRFLRPMGLGTYHTSLRIRGFSYTFAGISGITRTNFQNEPIPANATLKESINLGECTLDSQGEINQIIDNLRSFFHGTSYHLANRNCNHFTETFAMALLMGDRLIDEKPTALKKYPQWVNRLAKTGTSLGLDHGDVCKVWLEARKATGSDKKISHNLSSTLPIASRDEKGKKSKKKELTEKQKIALAKLRKSKS